jgi:hypothetical protein
MMYERTADPAWLALARSWTKGLLPVAKWTGSHDLGFMIGLPAGLAMRLDPDPAQRVIYRRAIIDAAKSLSARWNNKVKAIKSGEYNGKWGLIIDSAMNAPMLIEAGNMIGGTEGAQLRSRGEQHLLTLTKFFVRSNEDRCVPWAGLRTGLQHVHQHLVARSSLGHVWICKGLCGDR